MKAIYLNANRSLPRRIIKHFGGIVTMLCLATLCSYTIHNYNIWRITHSHNDGRVSLNEYLLEKRTANLNELPRVINGTPIDNIISSVQTKSEQDLLYSFAQINQNDYEISQPFNIDKSSNEDPVTAFIKG